MKLPPRAATSIAPSRISSAPCVSKTVSIYTEPSEFHFPPRHALGAILLEAGRPGEAETVYWEDLRRNRENGWALFGLLQALRAQSKNGRRRDSWKRVWRRRGRVRTSR